MLSGAGMLGLPAVASADTAKKKETSAVPPIPWGYVELDPEEVRKLGHLGYYASECGAGAVWAIFYSLRKKKGYPYTLLPIPDPDEVMEGVRKHKHVDMMFHYAVGGVEGYATLCGAANGSAFALECARGMHKAKGIIRRLYRWYESEAFPSEKSNELAKEHKFLVPYYKSDKPLPRVVSHSVLCHVQVSHWCKVSGYASGSKERSERCARIAGDVAAHAVELMNVALKGELYKYPFVVDHDTASCRVCHYKGKIYEQGAFDRGYMECAACHTKEIKAHAKESELKTAFGIDIGDWVGAATIGSLAVVGTHLAITNFRGNGNNGNNGGEKGGKNEENGKDS